MKVENCNPEISIILPCLNEEKSISKCLDEIKQTISYNSLNSEVVIIDNNSTDNTVDIAEKYKDSIKNLRIIKEEKRGYGNSCLRGLNEALGKILFIADADYTYSFLEINSFIKEIKKGYDLVVGNRFTKKLKKESMPWHHRYIGNPFLSFLVKTFFKVKISDIHCGARAIKKDSFNKLTLYTGGMEFASEMIIKASKEKLKINEIPIEYRPRIGESKLNSISDGWRHLRFILLYSPLFLFLLPGIFLLLTGLLLLSTFYFGEPKILGIQFYIHPMFLFAIMTIVGYQLIIFSGFAKIYSITHLGDKDKIIEKLFKNITLEKAGSIGILFTTIGIIIYISIFLKWIDSNLGSLDETKNMIVALVLTVIGIQTFFSAFMFSILGIKEK
jgi:glycosyltransferase involved in cell wall biosynthesis